MSLIQETRFFINLFLVLIIGLVIGTGIGLLIVPQTVTKNHGAIVTVGKELSVYIVEILRFGIINSFIFAIAYFIFSFNKTKKGNPL